ncbi:OmpA family protein [Actibacterium ureilyticum]|uniref:OmpA family protein n=1 Tax=Actibacterium ureilyticum TaxID=1590614 RepID=UPI000BAB23C4|nr:OmpA family protein [Actibacterium ureilyticum]
MRLSANLIAPAAVLAAGVLSLAGAYVAVNVIENRAAVEVHRALVLDGISFTDVSADGLQLRLTGTAPTEAARFRALTVAGTIVDSARVIDAMDVAPSTPLTLPSYSLELLRNDDGVSMIGLIPSEDARVRIGTAVQEAISGGQISDMLETADHPAPKGWNAALNYGIRALELLPRSKISVSADRVAVTAISESPAQRAKFETELTRNQPKGIDIVLDISAPRPVITPFTLRVLLDEGGARFDACSADTEGARKRILDAARAIGLEDGDAGDCTIGLGVPTPDWAAAVETGIAALGRLGGGALTFSDADVTLVALDSAEQDLFDRVSGELESDLPDVFSLHAVLPEPVKVDGTGTDTSDGPPEFVATKSPEGQVQLRGRTTNALVRQAAESYARSRFGLGNVYAAMRLDSELPAGWPLRVLTGLEALSDLNQGIVVVQPEFVSVKGVTGDPQARARISRLVADKLGDAQNFEIDVRYDAALDPVAGLPSPQQCIDQLNAALSGAQIKFEPGSSTIDGASLQVVDKLADILKECPEAEFEIGGHTDSQGREEMNLQLSQQRADAVLQALMARRILTTHITAQGYGETVPIADNQTEDGREANRRIEFKLIEPETPATEDTTDTSESADEQN